MGKPGSQPQIDQSTTVPGTDQSSTSISHFSHPHPLHLSSNTGSFNSNLCSGCKHEASGTTYTCTACNYSLHQKCSQMPQKITHPSDANNHVLSLLAKPAYPEGIFNCDACGEQGNGFCYHCQTCGIDLHILCASLPLVITHQSHHHQLNLTFSPPYPIGTFSCDICRGSGSKNWLYRCNICEFDVHLTCVNMLPSNRPVNQPPTQQSLLSQFNSLMSRPTPLPPPQTAYMANHFANHGLTNPVGYNSFAPAGGFSPFQPQPQTVSRVAVAATPFAAPTPMQNGMPQNNFMHPGSFRPPFTPAGYAQQNSMTSQIVGGVANGLASGASQAAAQALIQGIFGGGGGGGNGGGGNDISGFNTGADVVPADPGTYFVSDGSFTQMDGGYGGGDVTTSTY